MTVDHQKPCASVAPVPIATPTAKNPAATKPLLCNRPYGHDGNHSYSTPRQARLYEWERAAMVNWPGHLKEAAHHG